jgi:lipoprotein NlpI
MPILQQAVKWPLFGRQDDLIRVLQRVEHPGVTFVCALPAQGKTRLLVEIRDRLINSSYPTGQGRSMLVGYDEAAQETTNTLLRALKDLYLRWLGNASYMQQAKKVWKDQRGHLVERFGKLAGKTGDLLADPTGIKVSGLVDGLFSWLVEANQELKAGIAGLPTAISYEQTRDLLGCLHQITGQRFVLFLDAFEKSTNIKRDADNLDRFLRHLDEWPPCHFIAAVRWPPAAGEEGELEGFRAAERLQREHPAPRMELYRLGSMELVDSELGPLTQTIRSHLAYPQDWFGQIDQPTWLKLLNNYPGTLARWMTEAPSSLDDLARLAREAEKKQYTQLLSQLRQLCDEQRPVFRVAVRLAFLPAMRQDTWAALKSIVLDNDAPADALADLQKFRVLQEQNPPSFGHDTRLAAARHFIESDSDLRPYLPEQIKHLILGCARRMTRLDSDSLPILESLLGLSFLSESLDLEDWILGLLVPSYLIANASKAKDVELLGKWRSRMIQAAARARSDRSLAPLVSLGILAELDRATGERTEQWLNELRLLYEADPKEVVVRESFVACLFSAFDKSSDAIADQRLQELQQLYELYRDDDAFYTLMFRELVQAFKQVKGDKRDRLLPFFTKLMEGKKENKEVLDAVSQAVEKAREEGSGAGAELFLELAQKEYEEDRDSAQSRKSLAEWLFTLFTKASGEKEDELLQQLRKLSEDHPDDGFLRERLATAWVNALAKTRGEKAAQLLDNLRKLHQSHSDEALLRDRFALGLYVAFSKTEEKDALNLLSELRKLYEAHQADTTVRECFGSLLVNAMEKGGLSNATERFEELRKLYQTHSDQATLRQQFAMGLVALLTKATEEQAPVHFGELRGLYQQYRDDASIRETFAKGLLRALSRYMQNNDNQAAQSTFDEFNALCSQHEDDARLTELRKSLEQAMEQAWVGQPPSSEKSNYFGNRGIAKYNKGDYDGGIADFTNAISSDPKQVEWYVMRAEAKKKKGDLAGAKADLAQAIEVDPHSPRPYTARGDLKREEGDLSGALEDHTKAISLDPNNPTGYFYRAYLRYDTRYWAEALSDFRRLIELSYQRDYAAIRIWLIRARLGERTAATKELAEYFEARKDDASAEWTRTIAAFLAGRMPAAEFFRKAQDAPDARVKNGQLCEVYFYDATVHLIDTDTPNATTLFHKAVATDAKTYMEYRSAVAELKTLEYLSEYPRAPLPRS